MAGGRLRPRVARPVAGLLTGLGLVAYAAAGYLLLVVLPGALTPLSNQARLLLTLLAAAVVALTLEPVSERLRRLRPATSEERLRRLASGADPAADLGGRMQQLVRLVAESFGGSAAATLTADLGDGLTATWRWPDHAPPDAGNPSVRRPLRRGERVRGELTVQPDPPRPATPVEQRLLDDAADLAGLLVDSTRLDVTLQSLVAAADQRNRDLEESRRRVLVALEDERRRLERDIHDGAQQHLVALAVNLRLLRVLVTKDPPRASTTAQAVRSALLEAVHTLERLSVGLYPAVLTESGPAAALRAAAAASPVPVTVHADVRRRWPAAAERAAYFGCLEALQNAVKHAAAQRIVVTLSEVDGGLSFEVTDDGRGFDPANAPTGSGTVNLADRIAGASGRLTVISAPGRGTTVSGWIPTAVPHEPVRAV